MQAVVLREPGRAENLKLEEVTDPAPGAGDVVVRLKAAALNHRIEERVDTSFTAEGIFSAFDPRAESHPAHSAMARSGLVTAQALRGERAT